MEHFFLCNFALHWHCTMHRNPIYDFDLYDIYIILLILYTFVILLYSVSVYHYMVGGCGLYM